MRTRAIVSFAAMMTASAHAQTNPQVPYHRACVQPGAFRSAAFRRAGRRSFANEAYVEQLAHIVYYWAYPRDRRDRNGTHQHVEDDEGWARPNVRDRPRRADE